VFKQASRLTIQWSFESFRGATANELERTWLAPPLAGANRDTHRAGGIP
jgi:hypothetical protein